MGKKTVTNTIEQAKKDHMMVLTDAVVFGSNAIERQEVIGQSELVTSDTLPTHSREAWKILEKFGVKRLGPVEGNPLFTYAELPAGWKKERTEHSVWSNLVDNKGRVRASMFYKYKAAFYDRIADILVNRRFDYGLDYDRADRDKVAVSRVYDCKQVVFSTEPGSFTSETRYPTFDAADGAAKAWLDSHYPDWRNPEAYWD